MLVVERLMVAGGGWWVYFGLVGGFRFRLGHCIRSVSDDGREAVGRYKLEVNERSDGAKKIGRCKLWILRLSS